MTSINIANNRSAIFRPSNYSTYAYSSFQIYISNSIYVPFVEDWIRVFGRRQLMVINSEHYFSNTATTNQQIYKFLGLGMVVRDNISIFLVQYI